MSVQVWLVKTETWAAVVWRVVENGKNKPIRRENLCLAKEAHAKIFPRKFKKEIRIYVTERQF